jgi:hypothetical protein
MTLQDDVKTILGVDGGEYDSKLALFVPFAEGMLKGKGVVDTTSEKYKMAVAIIVSEKLDGKSDFSIDLDSIVLQLKYCYIAAPSELTGTISGEQITLSWKANKESDLVGYKIYKDSVQIGNSLTNSFQVAYSAGIYQVTAYDDDQRESKLSQGVML